MRVSKYLIVAMALFLVLAAPARAADLTVVQRLTIKDHKFNPRILSVPSNKKIKIVILNSNGQTAEFQSFQMHANKIIEDGDEGEVVVGPLKRGSYTFIDKMDVNKATGKLIVN